jgi:hypothetical protein
MKIACWSGPRNISTALMRSWSSRNDTFISDEPFYAYYLKETGLKHPMYKEIINYYPNNYDVVIDSINKNIPESKNIWYQKHMAHHLIDLENIEWVKNFDNCFLIRHPKKVISSYIKKNKLNHVSELGYTQQYEIMNYLKKINKNFVVIDADILLKNPNIILNKWCKKLEINFDKNMLNWEKKYYSYDGIWAKHWYDSVIETNAFSINLSINDRVIDKEYLSIYKESLEYYNEILKEAIER